MHHHFKKKYPAKETRCIAEVKLSDDESEDDENLSLKNKLKISDSADKNANVVVKEEKVEPNDERKKRMKQKKKKKIIIRNLSFKVEEDDLKEIFSKFGNVLEVKIPLKEDGKKRGFGFVEFESTKSLIQAMKEMNYKEIKGRKVAVDFALNKDSYQQKMEALKQVPKESPTIKKEKTDEGQQTDTADSANTASDESDTDSEEDEDEKKLNSFLKDFYSGADTLIKNPSKNTGSDESSSGESDESESEDDVKDEQITKGFRKDIKDNEKSTKPKIKKESDDVSEGKTVFLRNVSFATDEDDLKEALEEEFGKCEYCLLCIDKMTEHPKGTAFIKFKEKTSADKIVASSQSESGVLIDGRKLKCSYAISRKDVSLLTESPKEKKDKRNLHLLKVGVIAADSKEAEDVSQADLAKRNTLSQMKHQRLKNVNFFVSDKRLMVHNIPQIFTDNDLRKLFKKAAGVGTVITEARVMKELKKTDSSGTPLSKGFGFVSFEKPEDALKALNEINNNPAIFSDKRRPIVEFSVENKMALLAKERRKEVMKVRSKKRYEEKQLRKLNESATTVEDIVSESIQKGKKKNKRDTQRNDKKQGKLYNLNPNRHDSENAKRNNSVISTDEIASDSPAKKKHKGKKNAERNSSLTNTNETERHSPAKGKKRKRKNKQIDANNPNETAQNQEESSPKKRKKERRRKGKKSSGKPNSQSISSLIDVYKDKLKNKIS